MGRLSVLGRSMYCIGMIGLGVLCIISKDFIIGRPPATIVFGSALVYVSAVVVILSSVAILLNRKAWEASLLIAALILLLSVGRHIPSFANDWLNGYKAMALFGGTLSITASYIANRRWVNILSWTGSILLCVFFTACGYAHIKFHDFVRDFIPAYIPFHAFFAWFTAVCLIAGGIALLIPAIRKWGALLCGIMVFSWFILLHIPRFLMNTNDASDRMGLFESLAIAGIFFVLTALFARSEREDKPENSEDLGVQIDHGLASAEKAV